MSSQLPIIQPRAWQPPLEDAAPVWFHALPGNPPLVFLPSQSRLFEAERDWFGLLTQSDPAALAELQSVDQSAPVQAYRAEISDVNALSLNIAQACNLACSYCYADQGRFGGNASMMDLTTAITIVKNFLATAPGPRPTIGFIGGEPLLNRSVLIAAVEAATKEAQRRDLSPGFSMTTNGTLVTEADSDFFRQHKFSLSVSLDGGTEINDRHRFSTQRAGSAAKVIRALTKLLDDPGPCKICARVTVTRDRLDVTSRIEALTEVGFTEIGVAPLRTSPDASLILRDSDWSIFLDEMKKAAEIERSRLRRGLRIRFSNLATAIKQIHRGFAKPLPCGAAVNYISADARGNYYTCHRTVGDPQFYLGNLASGISVVGRQQFLRSRLVDSQEPCRTCWARYLCGGGCHAEVMAAGRTGCDFIRGWLEYCLRFYHWMTNDSAGRAFVEEPSHGA